MLAKYRKDGKLKELSLYHNGQTYPVFINAHPDLKKAFDLFIEWMKPPYIVELSMGNNKEVVIVYSPKSVKLIFDYEGQCERVEMSVHEIKEFFSDYLHFMSVHEVHNDCLGLDLGVKISF